MPRSFFRLLFLVLALSASPHGAVRASSPVKIAENDYGALRPQIRKSGKDVTAVRAWFERKLKPLASTDAMFTPECLRFLNDVALFNWDGSVTEHELRAKWGKRFDVARIFPDHPFENGNCGWESRKLAKFEHLGELNGGDWFRLTIVGGCSPGDRSQSLQRVVKIVAANGSYQIANILLP